MRRHLAHTGLAVGAELREVVKWVQRKPRLRYAPYTAALSTFGPRGSLPWAVLSARQRAVGRRPQPRVSYHYYHHAFTPWVSPRLGRDTSALATSDAFGCQLASFDQRVTSYAGKKGKNGKKEQKKNMHAKKKEQIHVIKCASRLVIPDYSSHLLTGFACLLLTCWACVSSPDEEIACLPPHLRQWASAFSSFLALRLQRHLVSWPAEGDLNGPGLLFLTCGREV
ncbi:hypothetical protein NDU88_002688 [Pleurodeles waltl]|uniref:Uncharacterized protein n=1 Tax=Pleurodeles waltl TaxID=8319 RepID=A0AAV7T353_PLEWA|nr:hypothetical protein NDU88_002688 [Pleurodeles waltl]